MKKLILFFVVMLLPMSACAFTVEVEIDGIRYYIITEAQTAEVREITQVSEVKFPKLFRKKKV